MAQTGTDRHGQTRKHPWARVFFGHFVHSVHPVLAACLIGLPLLAGCYQQNTRPPAHVPKTHAVELHGRAAAALRGQDYPTALRLADAAVAEDPAYAEASVTRAVTLARMGRLEEAADAYGALAEQWPGHPEVHAMRGIVLEKVGRDTDAREAYKAALGGFNELAGGGEPEPKVWLQQALSVYLLEGESDALVVLNRLLGKYPDYAPALEIKRRVLAGDRSFVMQWLEDPRD